VLSDLEGKLLITQCSAVDLGNVDLGNVDLGNVDLGNVDLGNVDLGNVQRALLATGAERMQA
jgi:uncharacterized protein YjbI with pentapeptide repeats